MTTLWFYGLPGSPNRSSECLRVFSHICFGNSLSCLKDLTEMEFLNIEKIPLRNRGENEKAHYKSYAKNSKMWPTSEKMFILNCNVLFRVHSG